MTQYIYPQNLKAKANLWLWGLRDFVILSVAVLISVVLAVHSKMLLPGAISMAYGVLTIRADDTTVLDYLGYAVRYFITTQQSYEYCILVMNEELDEGILVNSGGSGFARNVSFFPNVSAYLQAQNQKMTQREKVPRFSSSTAEESPDAVVRQVTPSLLAYGEKVERYVDACVVQALDGYDDQASYDFFYAELRDGFDGGGLDKDVFMAMLQARPEVVDMDVRGDAVGVVLSLESIQEHEDSKRRILTQDAYIRAFEKMIVKRRDNGKPYTQWKTGEEVMQWWLWEGARSKVDRDQMSIWNSIENMASSL